MKTYTTLKHHAQNGTSLRLWGLIQDAIGLSKISWQQFAELTEMLRVKGQFRIRQS
jgi:hypothetical protein